MNVNKMRKSIALLMVMLLLSFVAIAQEKFDKALFMRLIQDEIQENRGRSLNNIDKLRELLVEAGMAEEKAKKMNPIDIAEMFVPEGSPPLPMDITKEDVDKLNKQFEGFIDGHRPALKDVKDSTVSFFKGRALLVYGTVVHKDGLILTKESEVKKAGSQLKCLIGKKWYSAKVIKSIKKHDLALVKVNAKNLTPVHFHNKVQRRIGAFVTSPDPQNEDPIGIGVLSVLARNLDNSDRGFLGVQLAPGEGGVLVGEVLPKTAALEAGIKTGDVITEVNGKKYETVQSFIDKVSKHRPGEKLNFKVKRGEKEMKKTVALGQRPKFNSGFKGRFDRMNEMGTELSDYRDDFPVIIQHDIPIVAQQCGGPLVNLDGKVIGINIARAGRVKTYAIPSTELIKIMKDVNTKELLAKYKSDDESEIRDAIARHRAALMELTKEMQAAEKALRKARLKAQATLDKLQELKKENLHQY